LLEIPKHLAFKLWLCRWRVS